MQEDYNKYTVPILNRVGKSMLPTHGWYRELVLNYLITHNWLSKKKHSFRDNIFYKDAYQITLHERTLSITCNKNINVTTIPILSPTIKKFLEKGEDFYIIIGEHLLEYLL